MGITGSATHNTPAAVFLFITVVLPMLYMCYGAVAGWFEGGKKPMKYEPRIPNPKMGDENPLFQTEQTERKLK